MDLSLLVALPWFNKVLDSPILKITLKQEYVHGDQSISDEDSPIDLLEVYVM